MGYTVQFQNSLLLGEFQNILRKLFYIINNKYYFIFINYGKKERKALFMCINFNQSGSLNTYTRTKTLLIQIEDPNAVRPRTRKTQGKAATRGVRAV